MSEASTQRDEQQIRELIVGWCKAAEDGDVAAMGSFLDPEVLFIVAGQALAGGEPYMSGKQYLEGSAAMAAAVTMKIDNTIEELVLSGDLAVVRQSFVIDFTPLKGGETTTYAGPSMLIFRRSLREDGQPQWLVWRDANMVGPLRPAKRA